MCVRVKVVAFYREWSSHPSIGNPYNELMSLSLPSEKRIGSLDSDENLYKLPHSVKRTVLKNGRFGDYLPFQGILGLLFRGELL